jgi:hypothetical protein
MSGEFEEKVVKKRVEALSSRESSFYTLSNRIIMPMVFVSLITLIPISYWPTIVTFLIIIAEVVIRYILGTTMKNFFRAGYYKIFGSQRKSIKN